MLCIVELEAVGPGASETSAYIKQIRRCHNPEGPQQILGTLSIVHRFRLHT